MAERKIIEVDEDYLKQMMAGDIPSFKMEQKPRPDENQEENPVQIPEPEDLKEPVKVSKRKSSRQFDFSSAFLKEAKLRDRRQIYISGDIYEKIYSYLWILNDGKTSLVGYVNNILAHHIEEYKDMINEMYQQKISNKPL